MFARTALFRRSLLNPDERREWFAAFLSVCEWVEAYHLWRPNLRDESDSHVMELAVAGGASYIVTNNLRDLKSGELRFPSIRIRSPQQILEEL